MRRKNILLITTMLLGLITGCDSTRKVVVNTIYLDSDNNQTISVDVNAYLEVLNVESNTDLGKSRFDKDLNTTLTYLTNRLVKDNKVNLLLGYKKEDKYSNYYVGYVYGALSNLADYNMFVNEYDILDLNTTLSPNKVDFATKLHNYYPFNNLNDFIRLDIKDYVLFYNQLGTFSKDEFVIYNKANNASKVSNDYSSSLTRIHDYIESMDLSVESEKIYPMVDEWGLSYLYEGFKGDMVFPYKASNEITSLTSHISAAYDLQTIANNFNNKLHEDEETVVNQVAREVLGEKYKAYRSYIYDKLLYDGEHKLTSKKIETEDVIYNHIINKLGLNKEDIQIASIEYQKLGLEWYYIVSMYTKTSQRYQIIGSAFYLFVMNATLNGDTISNLDYEVTCEKFGINEFINETHSGQF